MTIRACIEDVSFNPNTLNQSLIIIELYLIEEDTIIIISEYGSVDFICNKFGITNDRDNYDLSTMQDRDCLLFKKDNDYSFDKYI